MSEEEIGRQKKYCSNKRVWIGLIALLLLILGIAGMTVTCFVLEQKVLKYNHHYGVIFDAGSSHTDVTVYQWPSGYKDHGTAHTKQILFTNCSDVGISSFSADPKHAGNMIKECVENKVLKHIPHKDVKKTPIYLGATAGMRLLCKRDEDSCDKILDAIRRALNGFTFRQTKNRVRVLTGLEEGTFGWITANILKGALKSGKPADNNTLLIGGIDMGGASAEISFIPEDKNIPTNDSSHLTLYGVDYTLYTHSYLCYGFAEAQRRMMAHLVEASNFTNNVIHPCMNKGSNITQSATYVWLSPCSKRPNFQMFPLDNKTTYTFIGNGSVDACANRVKELFNETDCRYGNCTFDGVFQPPLRGHFMAYSGLGHIGKFLNISKGDELNEINAKGREFCKKDWDEVEKEYGDLPYLKAYCFQALYSYGFLTYGLNFRPDSKDVQLMRSVNGTEVGWSLGFMVNATNAIPVESPSYRISQQEFVAILVVSSLMTVIGLAMLVVCIAKKKLERNTKYKYSMIH